MCVAERTLRQDRRGAAGRGPGEQHEQPERLLWQHDDEGRHKRQRGEQDGRAQHDGGVAEGDARRRLRPQEGQLAVRQQLEFVLFGGVGRSARPARPHSPVHQWL